MGLDAVELVMAIEEKFGITIADEEAQETTTPRKLTDFVLSKVKVGNQRSCLSQKAFHLLRRKAMASLAVPRAQFRPETRLDEILPMARRRVLWTEWQTSVGAARWPELCRSKLALGFLATTVVVGCMYTWSLVRETTSSSFLAYAGATLVALGVGWLGAILTRPWKRQFPGGYSRVGELSQFLVARNPELLRVEENGWTHERVWCVIRDLIIEQTGTADFDEDSDFTKDIFK